MNSWNESPVQELNTTGTLGMRVLAVWELNTTGKQELLECKSYSGIKYNRKTGTLGMQVLFRN